MGREREREEGCRIVSVGKRRDGGTRYWCLRHKADATAKYGRRARSCRYAHVPPVTARETLVLDLDAFPGGVALWGAVPPIYDTTSLPLDRGIHVHARRDKGGAKVIDATFRAVRVVRSARSFLITELDAIYYMVTSVFGYPMKEVVCSSCGESHLDKDWFSLHPHRRHLCAGCGLHFRDVEIAIGNPTCGVQTALGVKPAPAIAAKKSMTLRQADYPGGLRIWGSNSALLWTGTHSEREGVHLHAFDSPSAAHPAIDDTYARLTIDDITLDSSMVRTFMAQSTLPHLDGRVVFLQCSSCGEAHFDRGAAAHTPDQSRSCSACGEKVVARGRLRKVVGNPILETLRQLSALGPRPPQVHRLGLLPETL